MFRIGQSRDIHRLEEGYRLIIGGVEIPYEKGLVGHSDADVLTHAIIEAIIGALGLKDIGTHFPDTDPQYKGISSLTLLEETRKLMVDNGYKIVNVDSLVMIEKPKLVPYIEMMRENIANILECEINQINIKATRGEGLGFVGEGKGVEATAVCLLEKKDA